ncbi:MAG: alpha/beta hydrolase [Thermoanaerobaculia bacterium]|nr:alpha/beta hydrolase [Thermoanaerobaculia bacterium]
MIWKTLIGIALIALVAFGTAEMMRRSSLFYPDRYPSGDWKQPGLSRSLEDVWFEASDGTRLHGWLAAADSPGAPLLVFFHGNAGNITNRAVPSVTFAERGLSIFVFDYRGYGRSEGRPSEKALYDDSLAAWDVMRDRHAGPMGVYGESLGGPYAAYVADRRDPCVAIMDSTFPSLGSVVREIYRPLPVHWLLRPGLETAKHLESADVPVLVMHSTVDDVIPFTLGRELYEAIEGTKTFYQSDSAAHSAMSWYDGDVYFDTVLDFVLTHCGDGDDRG